MKVVKAAPGAKRLIDSLRHLGYECRTAIADLVDNSVAAGASEVWIDIKAQHGSTPAMIVIADNGHGMTRERLQEAMRFGSYQEYSGEDLGKYGLGLKTASLSQCRVLTVASKARSVDGSRPRRSFARWDLDHVDQARDWDLLLPTLEELEDWEQEALTPELIERHGTVVLWSVLDEALPELSDHDVKRRSRELAKLIGDVEEHLAMVFHRFLQGIASNRRRLRIFLNEKEVKPWDPFCLEQATEDLDVLTLKVRRGDDGPSTKVTIRPYILPREDEFSSSKEHKAAAGPRGWNQQQGFYFYRNDRLLQAGGWSWIRSVDEHVKLLRVAILFTPEVDQEFAINISKMRAKLPVEIKQQIAALVSSWAKVARDRYDRRTSQVAKATPQARVVNARRASGSKKVDASPSLNVGPLSFSLSNAPNNSLTVAHSAAAGQVRIIVPQNHEVAEMFSLETGREDQLKKLCLAMMSLLEALSQGKVKADGIPVEALKKSLRKLL